MGWPARIRDSCQNRLSDSIRILPHLAVPESHHAPAEPFEKQRPFRIAFSVFDMLATVDFDRDLCRPAGEIKHIASDRKLAGEARMRVAQALP